MKTNTGVTAHIFIRGHVQGVSFRANLWREAKKHNLMGWVRNLKDGSVEAVLQGEAGGVNEVIKWCHTGPAAAKVEKVDVAYESPQEKFTHFFIR
ncbi:MAG: acylphosphatase [Candidatus Altiarchaeia archaeon]